MVFVCLGDSCGLFLGFVFISCKFGLCIRMCFHILFPGCGWFFQHKDKEQNCCVYIFQQKDKGQNCLDSVLWSSFYLFALRLPLYSKVCGLQVCGLLSYLRLPRVAVISCCGYLVLRLPRVAVTSTSGYPDLEVTRHAVSSKYLRLTHFCG